MVVQPGNAIQVPGNTVDAQVTSFTFYCTNFGQLLPEQQKLFQEKLATSLIGKPEIYRGMLKLSLDFGVPIHSGAFIRRLEFLIFALRTFIHPELRFELSFQYGG